MSNVHLPSQHRPGTDIISIQEKIVMKLIVECRLGPQAQNNYLVERTEWINGTRSDAGATVATNDHVIQDVLGLCQETKSRSKRLQQHDDKEGAMIKRKTSHIHNT
ncbi:hypothetical protein BDC45DRAFT_534704 [Circinella umbellata]|nr:hypothetical protein BDC45DRAFT_534704 [Circinella umbellata]